MNTFYQYRYTTSAISDAVDNTTFGITTGGSRGFWGSLGAWASDGDDCATSGTITDSQTSSFSTTVSSVSCIDQVTFGWNVSSETNFDFLGFYINGVEHARISGTPGWATLAVALDPNIDNTLEWRYTKNASVSSNLDRGFVDAITYRSCPTIWNGSAWSLGAPTATDNAIINGDYNTSTGDITAVELTVNSTFTLTIADGNAVTVAGDLTNNGSIIVEDGGSFVQTKATPSNLGTGVYTVNRLADNYTKVYNYWSTPVQDVSINDVFGMTGKDFYGYNNTAWIAKDKSASLTVGEGFTATGTSATPTTITRSFTSNGGFNSGDITYTASFLASADPDHNWFLVGNPYPSGIEVADFLAVNGSVGTDVIENSVSLWGSNGDDTQGLQSDYVAIGLAGAVTANRVGDNPAPFISAGQGFMVKSKQAGTVLFQNSMRDATSNTFLRTKEDWQRIWLAVESDKGASNQILLGFIPEAQEGEDKYDVEKRSGNTFVSLYSLQEKTDEKLIIQGLPALESDRVVPFGVHAKEAGEFTFSIGRLENLSEGDIFLYDSETNLETDLRKTDFTVNLGVGEHNDRFSLRFIGGKITGISEDLAETGVSIFSHSNQIQINFADLKSSNSNIAVYDLQGRLLLAQSNQSKLQTNLELPEAINVGIFIVKVENANGVFTKKVYLE